MTYSQFQSFVPTQTVYSSNPVFQPGFAGTNVAEVRALNTGYGPQTPVNTYGAQGIGSIFQPGFAGTNVQEVRALNAGYPAPSVMGSPFSQVAPTAYQAQVPQYQAQVPQYQARPMNMGVSYGAPVNTVFQPGFAGTNAQEVRSLNAGYPAPSVAGQFGYATPFAQSTMPQTPTFGAPANTMFQPGFAGTNVQDVHRDWAQSQQVGSTIPYGVPTPYRTY